MRRIALLVLPLLTLFPLRADALTVRDVVELTRAGLGEDILLTLIEVDPSVFPIDTATLKMLKEAGVSERVIVAMIRSGRTQPPLAAEPLPVEEPPAAPEPQVVVIEHHDAPEVREVPVAVPVYVPVPVRQHHVRVDEVLDNVRSVDVRRDGVRRNDGEADRSNRSGDVYWGFGGQLRPDAWGQRAPEPAKPAQAPVKPAQPPQKDKQ